MNGLGPIACVYGFQDGINPCLLMTCAVFIAHGLWLTQRSMPGGWLRFIFTLVYAACIFLFNFGPVQILLYQKIFIVIAKILYFVLSVWAFISGVLFLKNWFLLVRGSPGKIVNDEKIKPFKGSIPAVVLATALLAVVLCALATLWPINNYIMLLGNITLLRGQWQEVMPLIAGYVLCSMWPLWFVWAFLSIKNLSPSMVKIIYASIFLTASSVMIFVFK